MGWEGIGWSRCCWIPNGDGRGSGLFAAQSYGCSGQREHRYGGESGTGAGKVTETVEVESASELLQTETGEISATWETAGDAESSDPHAESV